MSRISKDITPYFLPSRTKTKRSGFDLGFGRPQWLGWLPLVMISVIPFSFRNAVPPWVLMWMLAGALYAGCKWLTWWRCASIRAPWWRHAAYLIAWPGMDAKRFLESRGHVPKPTFRSWTAAFLKTIFGALLVWRIVRWAPVTQPLLQGWIGLIGLIFLLHFGSFQLLALAWQQLGVNAQPIMRSPILSKSLAEFWGKRWNSAFNLLVHDFLFRKLHRHISAIGATLVVFLVSGIIHDFVISVPARAGYGLPTVYFLLQGLGLCFERSGFGQKAGLRNALVGRCFTLGVTAIPAFWLFHPPFIKTVILPMLRAVGAT
jgi:hypothetical protein